MRRLVSAIAILAALAVHGASVGTAQFGDLGLNDNVVTNVDLSGLSMEETDPTVPAWAKTTNKPSYTASEVGVFLNSIGVTGAKILSVGLAELIIPSWAQQTEKPTYTATEVGATPASHANDFDNPHGVTCEQIDAAPASVTNEMAQIRTESSLVYRLYSGSNVVCEVTNYNSMVHAPTMRLMQLNESNEYVTVWTETNGLTRTLGAANTYTDSATNALKNIHAPRAWSRTTSGLGADAPSNTTWISTPRTVIAGGFEYAKIADTYGEVWVLTSNGMAADFNPDTNAYLRITADDGTPVFSVEKSDAQVVGADAEGITVSASSVVMSVPVVSNDSPTMYWRQSLDSGDWADQSSPPTGATVTWSGTAGTWVCTVTFTGTRPSSMFFRFSFIQEGGVKIRNNAVLEVTSGILCTDGIHKVRPVYNNGTITWEAVP